jgi:hypothetical protein
MGAGMIPVEDIIAGGTRGHNKTEPSIMYADPPEQDGEGEFLDSPVCGLRVDGTCSAAHTDHCHRRCERGARTL